MTRPLKYLNPEHKIAILKQRALELEADLFAQQTEHELAQYLGLDEVVTATEKKIELFDSALNDLEAKINLLEHPIQPVAARVTRKSK
jgi:hypothetical protein